MRFFGIYGLLGCVFMVFLVLGPNYANLWSFGCPGYGFLCGIMVFWGWGRGCFLKLWSFRILGAVIKENYGLFRGFLLLNKNGLMSRNTPFCPILRSESLKPPRTSRKGIDLHFDTERPKDDPRPLTTILLHPMIESSLEPPKSGPEPTPSEAKHICRIRTGVSEFFHIVGDAVNHTCPGKALP